MADIAVARAFTLTLNDGTRHSFVPGIYRNQPEAISEHWFTKFNLVPDEQPVDMAESPALDAVGIAAIEQARAYAEDQATRLRTELARITVLWTESELRARRAEAALAEAGVAVDVADYTAEERNAAYAEMKSERDAAVSRATEAEEATASATEKVTNLTHELQDATPGTDEPDEQVGDYVVRKRGRKYTVVKLDVYGKLIDTVAEEDTRQAAEVKANELKAVQ